MERVAGKTAIITGAASGIGAETARRLAAEGATVVLADINLTGAATVAEQIGSQARPTRLDVTDGSAWTALLERVNTELGPVHVLVNSAGVASSAPIDDLAEAEFRRVMDINALGTFLGLQAVVPAMRRAGGGSIINVSSLAGLVGMAQSLAYCASKWAVRGMTRSAALDLGADRIRVNSVHPGVIDTPILGGIRDIVDQILPPNLPLGRIGRADEIANMILFLASDESSYTTGCEFTADGGWSAS
ncbi:MULTISPECIES: glucose 1-dehydrogenase [Mycobacterium]|uniref:Oxidoreductase n=1 Tax=Mycobacterium kiyosense TaxID=2871094 RepID=A0A9P3QAB2_9MYCO|nr:MULTISPECIES: glucose 1-dehydrogenase [Mycobacterium]BDB44752.1 oxidoreductase [Mycobacterium kiyosense]BDE16248.1 oxidoreductase [Mycobacterium sp. 20KCMC460]GLB86072.1 oxidoreductase [Mycobacterium kiyosense]GLB92765.1 oxidoreductase [Mycobacterium kiyosense]GLB98680.1 oxidoreductase [Mycobacterium kiyosense]